MNVCYNMWFTNLIFLIYPFVTDKKTPQKQMNISDIEKTNKMLAIYSVEEMQIDKNCFMFAVLTSYTFLGPLEEKPESG